MCPLSLFKTIVPFCTKSEPAISRWLRPLIFDKPILVSPAGADLRVNSPIFTGLSCSTAKTVATTPVRHFSFRIQAVDLRPTWRRPVSSRLHSLSRYKQHSSRYHDVSSLFSENFLLRVLLARSRGYSRPWFRRLHSKQHKRFEMFTSLRVVLFHVSSLKNVLNCRNLV